MGIFDWLGPTGFGRRRGWDALPTAPRPETRAVDPPGARTIAFGGGAASGLAVTFVPTTAARPWLRTPTEDNSAVAACLAVLGWSIVEPELLVYRRAPSSGRTAVDRSPLGDLLARPNPVLTLKEMLAYATTSLHVDGNAYWRKIRSGDPVLGNVVELWPLSASRVAPSDDDGAAIIGTYRYTDDGGRVTDLPAANVVHFRYGLDDNDHRLGTSPLKRLIAEVSSDAQATRYADRLLANLAINGLTLSFDKDAPLISQETADELKARISAAYGGDNAGAAAVLSPGAQLTALGFSPEQMDMKVLHRVPEERISAVLGVPAIVAGLGAGLDRSTFSNFKEAREAFTELKLVPLWATLAETITLGLVPDFDRSGSLLVDFDLSQVRALSEDQDALATRLVSLVAAGILTTDEARAELGRGPGPEPATPPAETRHRPTLVRLPPQTKSIEELLDGYARLGERRLPTWEAELVRFFTAQLRRVQARLKDGAFTAAALVPDGEVVLLGETLAPLQLAMLDDVTALVVAELGLVFQLDDPQTREYLRRCGSNIVGITDTTRAQVRSALAEGQAAGEGVPALARRLRDLPAFGRSRAETVARTELGVSTTQASYANYVASGVVEAIRIHDGDYDEACAARNGRVISLDQAASEPPLLHPNCTAAWAPVVTGAAVASA